MHRGSGQGRRSLRSKASGMQGLWSVGAGPCSRPLRGSLRLSVKVIQGSWHGRSISTLRKIFNVLLILVMGSLPIQMWVSLSRAVSTFDHTVPAPVWLPLLSGGKRLSVPQSPPAPAALSHADLGRHLRAGSLLNSTRGPFEQ